MNIGKRKEIRNMKHLYLEDGSVNSELLDRPIIIWGCGNDGHKICQLLKNQKANIQAFCDSNNTLHHKLIMDIPVISCEDALERDDINLVLAFHQWINVIKDITVKKNCEIFADYLYEEAEQETECIICGSNECTSSRAHFAPFLVERMFSGIDVKTELIHCKCCDFWFSKYRPNDLEMEKLYDGYRGEEYVKQRQKYEPKYSALFYESDDYMERRKNGLNVFFQGIIDYNSIHMLLDYGGDEGQYIPAQFNNAEKYVFEISGNKVKEGIILLNNLAEVKKKRFDLVMCCQVLEHVSNPIEIIENMVGVLKNKGYLYIEVPNSNFFMAYSDVEINEHINFFFEETMLSIASRIGEIGVKKLKVDQTCRALFVKQ